MPDGQRQPGGYLLLQQVLKPVPFFQCASFAGFILLQTENGLPGATGRAT